MATARPNLNNVLTQIKQEYEQAITTLGRNGVHSLIRYQQLINHINEFVKEELVFNNVNRDKIYPPPGATNPEMKMVGLLKTKDQDISVLPDEPIPEVIQEGVLVGETDEIGRAISEKGISINIRSQLSSLAKNFDTLFERTFAEPLNLHLRMPNLIMGEVYMVPLIAYDPDLIDQNRIGFREVLPANYVRAFGYLNGRSLQLNENYKYERLCLLIIDFRNNPPTVVTTTDELVDAGIIEDDQRELYPMVGLDIENFVTEVLSIYKNRHGSLVPIT